MYYKSQKNGNPYFLFPFIAVFITFFISDQTLDNVISSYSFLFYSSLYVGTIIGGICIFLYKDFIFRNPDNEPFITGLLIIIGFIISIFSIESIINRLFDLKPPEEYEVEIEEAKQWTTISRSSKGGTTTHYHAKIYLKDWAGPSILNIKYGSAYKYQKNTYASIVIRTGLFNVKYISKNEIKPTGKQVVPEKIIVKPSNEPSNNKSVSKNFKTNSFRNIKNYALNNNKKNNYGGNFETEEEHFRWVYYNPRSPDFGKRKLPKDVYLSLSEEDKKRYRKIRNLPDNYLKVNKKKENKQEVEKEIETTTTVKEEKTTKRLPSLMGY